MKKQDMKNNIEAAVDRIRNLYQEMLHTGAQDHEYRRKIAAELFHLQHPDGSWRVIEDLNAPTDIRVEYIYIPTYYATAALMMYMNAEGDLAGKEKDRLKDGLRVAAERKLNGSGFEATRYRLNALTVYKKAGLYEWINKFGAEYPEFSDMIRSIIEEFHISLITGRTISDWEVNFKEDFQQELSDYEEAMIPWVWYAAYGSNISRSRFMRYIERCTDKSEPEEVRRYVFPHDIMFAGTSRVWGNKGKAFLDDSKRGMALGRIYKIRRSQLDEIQRMEGHDYNKRLRFEYVEDIPVYAFTAEELPQERKSPSADYFEVILKGLKETYPEKSELSLQVYLFSCGAMETEDMCVLSFIRNSDHGVSLQTMADAAECPCITHVRKSVKKLLDFHLIKQDSRSQRAGNQVQDREAVFYTRKEKRDIIDTLLVILR